MHTQLLLQRRARCSTILSALLVGTLAIAPARGQSKTGTTIGQFTVIEPSARVAAMGGAGVTSAGEALAGFYNPAALGAMTVSDIQFTRNFWFADIGINSAAAAFRLGERMAFSVALTHLTSGDIDVRTVAQPLGTGERFTVTDLQIGAGIGIGITDRFSCGLQVNYVTEQIWHSSVHLFGVNIGTLYRLSEDGLRVGASLTNFGTKGRFDGTDLYVRYDVDPSRYGDNSSIPATVNTDEYSMPIVFRVGLGYPVVIDGANTVDLALDALSPSDNPADVNVGVEWAFKRVVYLRLGYSNLIQNLFPKENPFGEKDREFGFTAGAGIAWDGLGYLLRVDYSWGDHRRLGGVQRLTFGIGF